MYSSLEDEMRRDEAEATEIKKKKMATVSALRTDGKFSEGEGERGAKAVTQEEEEGVDKVSAAAVNPNRNVNNKHGTEDAIEETVNAMTMTQDEGKGQEQGREYLKDSDETDPKMRGGEKGGGERDIVLRVPLSADAAAAAAREKQIVPQDSSHSDAIVPSYIRYPVGHNGRPLVLPQQATQEELAPSTQPAEDTLDMNSWKDSMPNPFAEDFDDLFRDENEVKAKEVLFNRMNVDYLEREKKKASERKEKEDSVKDKDNDEAVQEEKRARYLRKKSGRKRRFGDEDGDDTDGPSTEEALLAEISRRKISRKINYDAMTSIFDDDGGFSTENLEDGNGPGPSDLPDDPALFGML